MIKKLILLFTMLCVWQLVVKGQSRYSFNHITKADKSGLLSDIVYTTYQDEQGYIWTGTANGLQRFDGNAFKNFSYSKPNKQQLPLSAITQIIGYNKHYLFLFLGAEKKAGLFDTRNFKFTQVPVSTTLPMQEKNYEMKLYKDAYNNVFLFIWKYGILHYDTTKNVFTDDNFFKLQKGQFTSNYFFEDKQHQQMWLPLVDSGLAIYDYKSRQLYTNHFNPINNPFLKNKEKQKGLSEICIDNANRYWMFYWRPNHEFRCYDAHMQNLPDTMGIGLNKEYAEARNFFESSEKILWLYGNNCLYHFDNNTRRFVFYRQKGESINDIKYQFVHNIMEDRDGLIWISTDNGLYITSTKDYTNKVTNKVITTLENNTVSITDVLQLANNDYWVSTWGNGILTYTSDFKPKYNAIYKNIPLLPLITNIQYKQAWSLFQQKNGMVWIGCQGGKYMLYDTAKKITQFLTLKESENATIRYITGDKKGNVWLGTQRGHLIQFDGVQFKTLQQFDVIIRKILIDNDGLIWVATEGRGLFCLNQNGKVVKQYSINQSGNQLFTNLATDIEQLNDSTIVCAAGVLHFINKKNGKVTWVSFENGLPGNTVIRIRKDAKGYLWINTLDGLCRYNPIKKNINLYNQKDGIEFANFTLDADLLTKNGWVIFCGSSHVMYFNPEVFENVQSPPKVTITGFKIFNKDLSIDSLLQEPLIHLDNSENSVTIDFSALSYLQKDKLIYFYRLKGVEDNWERTDRMQSVSYTLLPPGKYEFQVYCENIDGIASAGVTTVKFNIMPPLWRTGWFTATLLTLLCLFIYSIHLMRIRRILEVENIRTRVARDLHDDMGSTLSTINILSTMANARLYTDTQKTAEYINKISDNSQRMMEAMDDIVWAIKPSNDTMQKVVARMREFATSVLEAKNIEIDFNVDENIYDIQFDMEGRRDLFLFFKEAINNAAKYSKASNVVIRFTIENKRLQLVVKDNGTGFNVNEADSGNGLGNMRKRAESLKGTVQIQSQLHKGTTVTLTIPFK